MSTVHSSSISVLFSSTVTTQEEVYPPSAVVAVIVVLPALTPVIVPLLTVATFVLLLVQLIVLLEALNGETVAVRVVTLPCLTVAVDSLKETLVTGIIFLLTVILQVAV